MDLFFGASRLGTDKTRKVAFEVLVAGFVVGATLAAIREDLLRSIFGGSRTTCYFL